MDDADAIIKVCDIYDRDIIGELDLLFLGDVMYALGMNTTKKMCNSLVQTDEEEKNIAKFDGIVEKVNADKTFHNATIFHSSSCMTNTAIEP